MAHDRAGRASLERRPVARARGRSSGSGWRLACSALCLAGELERALDIAAAAIERRASGGRGPSAFADGELHGQRPAAVAGTIDDGARRPRVGPRRPALRVAAVRPSRGRRIHALCLIEKGELERCAARWCSRDGPLEEPVTWRTRCGIYAAGGAATWRQGRARRGAAISRSRPASSPSATRDVHSAIARGAPSPPRRCWRSATLERATRLARRARRERTESRRRSAPARSAACACSRSVEAVRRRSGLLARRRCLGERMPPRLETVRALLELGAALRRANQRAAAREPLGPRPTSRAQEVRCALQDRARTELAADRCAATARALLQRARTR